METLGCTGTAVGPSVSSISCKPVSLRSVAAWGWTTGACSACLTRYQDSDLLVVGRQVVVTTMFISWTTVCQQFQTDWLWQQSRLQLFVNADKWPHVRIVQLQHPMQLCHQVCVDVAKMLNANICLHCCIYEERLQTLWLLSFWMVHWFNVAVYFTVNLNTDGPWGNVTSLDCMLAIHVMSCHVITPLSLCNGWLHGWVSDVQHLLSLTVCSRLSLDRPVHWQMLSKQHIRCLPQFLTPSTRPINTLPSTLSCGCLITLKCWTGMLR